MPPLEILSCRGLWSWVFFALIVLFQRRLHFVGQALARPRMLVLIVAGALIILANWFGFIFAISVGKTIEASLGVYIFPLAAVLLGWPF